jgi:DNA-3-methyladenine glycosylase II
MATPPPREPPPRETGVIRIIETEDDLSEGLAALPRLDPRWHPVLAVAGRPPLRRRAGGFEGLAGIVVSQQLSVASAAAIWSRVRVLADPLTPDAILAAPDNALRAAGLSRPKIVTLRAVADAVQGGALPLESLARRPAEEAHVTLTQVRGIGAWTADIYLMFCLGHADAFAPGDLALQEAARIAFALGARPDPKRLGAVADIWRPWRGVAARVLWAYYKAVKTREGVA